VYWLDALIDCIDCYVVILGGHAGLMVVMPSLTSLFLYGCDVS
jgi:hypothetical protein